MHVTITDGSFSFRGQATHRVDCLVDAPCDLLTLLKPSCNMMKMSGDSCTMKSHWRTSLGCPRVTVGSIYLQGYRGLQSTSICSWDAAQQNGKRAPYGTALLDNCHSIARKTAKTPELQFNTVQERNLGSLRMWNIGTIAAICWAYG